jgi:hypothetical protein
MPLVKKGKAKGKGMKRPAEDPESAHGSGSEAKRTRRNRGKVDYTEKTVEDL